MLIDGFTVAAQAINFVVLVWLLKRFLYQPVLDAIAARESRIAQQLDEATAAKEGAEALQHDYAKRSKTLESERSQLLDQARAEAKAEHDRLIAQARAAADEVGAQRQEALRNETAQLQAAIGNSARREVFAITRRALADLATASFEERLADVLVRQLEQLDGSALEGLVDSLNAPDAQPVVRSAFALPPAQQAAIQAAVRARAPDSPALSFTVVPEGLGGIELLGAGRKLAWGIDTYLEALEHKVAEQMAPAAAPDAA
jgi:F-type H+-transporting ATPase subunit b